MPRTRLLFVMPDLGGGGAPRVALALLGAMDHARYELSLLNLGRRGTPLEAQLPPGVRLLHRPRWLPGGLLGARLATLWHAIGQDLLVAGVEMRATFCVHFAARLLRKPAVAWVHIAFEQWAQGFGARHQRRSRAAYRDIHSVVFVAEGARASMARWLDRGDAQWTSIPNLFRSENYRCSALTQQQQALLDAMPRQPTILGIGSLGARKGFDLLIAAVAMLRDQGLICRLVILGEGPRRAELLDQVRSLGLEDRVDLPGHVGDPLPWLRAATVYALSSRLEGLPTTILEAFATGTPVVATDCPSGPAEMLAGDAGLLVPVDDATALTQALRTLLASPEHRGSLAERGSAALVRYRPEAVLPQWDAVIERELEQRRQ